MNRRLLAMLLVAVGLVVAAQEEQAATLEPTETITFDGLSSNSPFTGPASEGSYTYERISGSLVSLNGRIIGSETLGQGGTLSVKRTNGGTFEFLQLAAVAQSNAPGGLTVAGYLNGNYQGSAGKPHNGNFYFTIDPQDLASKPIDELQFYLDASHDRAGYWVGADSIQLKTLANVPEPKSLALLGLGGLLLMQRRR